MATEADYTTALNASEVPEERLVAVLGLASASLADLAHELTAAIAARDPLALGVVVDKMWENNAALTATSSNIKIPGPVPPAWPADDTGPLATQQGSAPAKPEVIKKQPDSQVLPVDPGPKAPDQAHNKHKHSHQPDRPSVTSPSIIPHSDNVPGASQGPK